MTPTAQQTTDLDRHMEALARLRAIRERLMMNESNGYYADANYPEMATDVIKYLDQIRPKLGLD